MSNDIAQVDGLPEQGAPRRATAARTRLGAAAMWLSIATVVWGLLFPIVPRLIGPLLSRPGGPVVRVPMGFAAAGLELILAVGAFVTAGVALKRGDRARPVVAALVLAALVGGFWILFALGEVLVPH